MRDLKGKDTLSALTEAKKDYNYTQLKLLDITDQKNIITAVVRISPLELLAPRMFVVEEAQQQLFRQLTHELVEKIPFTLNRIMDVRPGIELKILSFMFTQTELVELLYKAYMMGFNDNVRPIIPFAPFSKP